MAQRETLWTQHSMGTMVGACLEMSWSTQAVFSLRKASR